MDDENVFSIHVDGCVIEEIDSFKDAVCALLGVYWIFDIEFAKSVRNTLTFLAVHILKLKVHIRNKVIRFLN